MNDASGSPQTDRTSATLLLRLRDDGLEREVAWSEFFRIYAPVIRAFARRMGADPDTADEVVQELMRRFFQASPTFAYSPSKGRFRGYLKTCAYRVLIELRGARAHEASLDFDVVQEEADEDLWVTEWKRRRLTLAMEKVKKQYTRRKDSANTYRAFEQFSLFKQPACKVATELGMSLQSVHTANSRVMKSLRVAIEELRSILD